MTFLLILLAFASTALAADLPHAHQVGSTGWWECDRDYVMQTRPHGFACVPEADVPHEPAVILSTVPSAGEGARGRGGQGVGQGPAADAAGARPEAQAGALPVPLFIQSTQPWTVILDGEGRPATVIVGGPASRPAGSALLAR